MLLRIMDEAIRMGQTSLYLSNKHLTELPIQIGTLPHLKALYLAGNQISELPMEIETLTLLEELYLSNNQIRKLPIGIGKLTNLTILLLLDNQLKKLPSEIGNLTSLKELFVHENQICELPVEICNLKKLKKLNLSHNQLKKLPPEIGHLTNLTSLDLSYNQLRELPVEILNLSNLKSLDLKNNPLISPPLEIIHKGIGVIRNYLSSLHEESRILNEVKILFIGEGAAGKTSLTKCLLEQKFNKNESQTHGIRLKNWLISKENKEIKINLWDFGGQEIMHATHQFFLSKRSLYVLVLDARRDEKAEYWLRHIESFGGDSPVLVVLNKYDENPGFNVNQPFLQKKYPAIKGFYRTSCSNGHGIKEFRASLIEELSKVKMTEIRWANNWFKVKQKLETMMYEPYISCDQYEKICKEAGITEEISQGVLVDFLHDLGVVVHFNDFELEDTHILEPRWVTGAVYKIINSEMIALNNGVLSLKDLKLILKSMKSDEYSYPKSKHKYIIGLMKKFELCYSIDDETVLIPQLLNVVEPPFEFDYTNSLKLVLSYEDFLPGSIMPRFIVKTHKDIKDELRWRTGVVLANEAFGTVAVVKADKEANRIDIFVDGEGRKDYLAVILLFFREINKSFEKLKFDERVPMPDDPEVTASYKTLINSDQKGVDQYIPDGSDKVYNVKELLGLIQIGKKDRLEKILEILMHIKTEFIEEKSLENEINNIISLKPNIFGVGIDINEVIRNYRKRKA